MLDQILKSVQLFDVEHGMSPDLSDLEKRLTALSNAEVPVSW